jgi:hypothetical protein
MLLHYCLFDSLERIAPVSTYTPPRPTLRVEASSAPLAVAQFFRNYVRISDPNMSGEGITETMRDAVIANIFDAVAKRQKIFWNDRTRLDEIVFEFEVTSTIGYCPLKQPAPILKFLEYVFGGVHIKLDYSTLYLSPSGNCYALRVTPFLVTFAGEIVWTAPESESNEV